MINNQTVLAIIPARSGSKRCPGKNLREFRGKQLIAWSIEAAKGSEYIDHFVVSSEDPAIRWVAESYEVSTIPRPAKLATDIASNEDVMRHAWAWYGNEADFLVLLQPTSPLRTAADIDACIEIAAKNGKGCVSYRQRNGTKNGAVYVARADWLRFHDFSEPLPGVYGMDDERSLDIDYPEEFYL